VNLIVDTALAGKFMGKQLIYLEAGSGAKNPIPLKVITAVKQAVNLPIIVGGGIRTKTQKKAAFSAGADVVVMGTAFEK
jgi:putative glycerol-1-phosphate prenyltransferase